MKIPFDKTSAPPVGSAAQGRPRVSLHASAPGAIQRREQPTSRPTADLLALQRLIGRSALAPRQEDLNHGQIHEAARLGTSGPSGSLPHLETIQQSFGRHDVTNVQAFTGASATAGAQAMNAAAFTMGNRIAFAGEASLRTAAHEAAHHVQQRAGVQLSGGVGQVGDKYERHADAVAELVTQGRSAEALLSAGPDGNTASVQRQLEEEDDVPSVQRQLEDEEEDDAPVQSMAASAAPYAALPPE